MPKAEKKIIARIRSLVTGGANRRPGGLVKTGIGDDCAVLRQRPGRELLVTTDFNLEGTHFRRDWHSPQSVGHRCLARGLSDIAAMGGEPHAAFLSLALPAGLPQRWVNGFLDGMLTLAGQFDVELAGGDIAESAHGILADVMVIGSAPAGKAISRSGARPGDILYVTGRLGASAATLRRLIKTGLAGIRPIRDHAAHFFPEPRVAAGRYLRERRLAHAMIDLSDGLSTDLAHICEESGVGAVVNQLLIPQSKLASLEDALHGGEDYELLFAAPKSASIPVEIAGLPVTEIGWITREKKICSTDCEHPAKPLKAMGWEHFRRRD